jgi:hypothetical protein
MSRMANVSGSTEYTRKAGMPLVGVRAGAI